MITTTIALSFSLGAFAGVAMYLLGVSVARSREMDRRLRDERLRRAAHWSHRGHGCTIGHARPPKSPSCGKENW